MLIRYTARRDSLIYSYWRAHFLRARCPTYRRYRDKNRGNARDNNEPRRYPAGNNIP